MADHKDELNEEDLEKVAGGTTTGAYLTWYQETAALKWSNPVNGLCRSCHAQD